MTARSLPTPTARNHALDLRQCALWLDNEPVARAMTDAADFIEATDAELVARKDMIGRMRWLLGFFFAFLAMLGAAL